MPGTSGHVVINKNMLSQNLQESGFVKLKQVPRRKRVWNFDSGAKGTRKFPLHPEVIPEVTSNRRVGDAGQMKASPGSRMDWG